MLVGWVFVAPVTSRVSPRRASYFLLLRQKKVTKEKASHVRAASRSLALLAAFGTLANSLRSNSASVLIRTLLRCSARPNGGGIPHGSSASRTSPEWLARFAHIARVGLPHFSRLTSRKGTARRAATPDPSFLTPHFSSWATTRVAPTTSLLTPTTSPLTPHSSLLTPHSSPLTPHPSLLTPHSSLLTPHSSPLTPHSSLLTPHSSLLTPHSSLLTPTTSPLTPHSYDLTPHSSLLPPHSSLLRPHPSRSCK